MQIFYGHQTIPRLPKNGSILTLGNFDGFHLGHQQIFQHMQALKKTHPSYHCIAYTFRPHPQNFFQSQSTPLLMPYKEKLNFFANHGIEYTIEEPFNQPFAQLKAEEFFQKIILEKLQTQILVVGHDFALGNNRAGASSLLQQLCAQAQIEFWCLPAYEYLGEPICSSRIRSALIEGNIELANALLGRPFFYRNTVVPGAGRGKKLGFPTFNFAFHENQLQLPYGVYATQSRFNSHSTLLRSITHLGVRPTFEHLSHAMIETHILEPFQPTSEPTLEVQFTRFIRPERCFSSSTDLQAQIQKDIQIALTL